MTPGPDPAARLRDVRAVVTGAGSGIGRASALRLASEGAIVLATDRDRESAERVAAEIAAAGGRAEAAEVDVAAGDLVETLRGAVDSALGAADALVNNAGVGASGTVLETSDEDWSRLFSVNVDGVFRCSKALVGGMLERGGGSVVNIASVAGVTGLENRFAYCASKGAVVAMTRAMALDYAGTGLRVNAVAPGTIHTPWVESFATAAPDPDAFRRQMAARQPIGRMGTAEEIAAAVAYLASSDSEFVTGSVMLVDGGLTAGVPARPG